MNSNNLHVILGSGPVGQAVMRELCAKGQRVRMVNRRGHANGRIPRHRKPDVDFRRWECETRRHDADHLNATLVETDRSSNDSRVRS